MKLSRSLKMLALGAATATMAGARTHEIAAQSGAPAVDVLRNTSLNGTVLTGDFNGDGILDVAATGPWNGSSAHVVIALGKGDGTIGATTATSLFGAVMSAVDWAGDGTVFNVNGSGSDIWGTRDSFGFSAVPIRDYQQLTVRVRSIGNTNAWAKAGVMIRESLTPDAKHADAIVSPSKGIAMQERSATTGESASPFQVAGAAPVWLRIRRFEASTPGGAATFSTWYSTDFATWRRLGDVSIVMVHDAFIGIAVTSHHPAR